MQRRQVRDWLLFFERLYNHMDNTQYVPGILMLFNALPIKLQAHLLTLTNDNQLPDPTIFDDLA